LYERHRHPWPIVQGIDGSDMDMDTDVVLNPYCEHGMPCTCWATGPHAAEDWHDRMSAMALQPDMMQSEEAYLVERDVELTDVESVDVLQSVESVESVDVLGENGDSASDDGDTAPDSPSWGALMSSPLF
jgi:hypothetical protein